MCSFFRILLIFVFLFGFESRSFAEVLDIKPDLIVSNASIPLELESWNFSSDELGEKFTEIFNNIPFYLANREQESFKLVLGVSDFENSITTNGFKNTKPRYFVKVKVILVLSLIEQKDFKRLATHRVVGDFSTKELILFRDLPKLSFYNGLMEDLIKGAVGKTLGQVAFELESL